MVLVTTYQSSRTVKPSTLGAIVPAASPLPVAVYFPVFALLSTELFGPVNVNAAFRLVNCTSLNTLYAWSWNLMPLLARPPRLSGNRRDNVMSHSCHVGCLRIPTGLLPKLPTRPLGAGILNAARLKCGWSANGMFGSTV